METKMTQFAPMRAMTATPCELQSFAPEQVCTKQINFAVDDGRIDYVDFGGGCEGNLKAISNMIEGMTVDFVVDRFSGITCGSKTTSCVDQLCCALVDHMEKK